MGIRESLKQPGPENIKYFVMPEEEPGNELEFDVEKEITNEDWKGMKTALEYFQVYNKWANFAEHAARMKIISPDRFKEISISDEMWQKMIPTEDSIDAFSLLNDSSYYLSLKILRPDKFAQLNIDQDWKKINDRASSIGSPAYAANLKIISPTRFNEIRISDQTLDDFIDMLEIYRSGKNWSAFASYAKDIRILFPEAFTKLNIDKLAWQEMKKMLSAYRARTDDVSQWHFAWMAMDMKIIAAQDVKITDQGLELITPEKKSAGQQIPKRPERRTF